MAARLLLDVRLFTCVWLGEEGGEGEEEAVGAREFRGKKWM